MQIGMHDLYGWLKGLSVADETGLLGALASGGARSPDDWAQALGAHPRAVGGLLDLLVASGVAIRSGELYGPSEAWRRFAEDSPGGFGLTSMLWGHLPTFARTGEPLLLMDGDRSTRERTYASAVSSLARLFAPAATKLAAVLPLAPRRVLDVGCGSGVWSLAIAQAYPECHVTGQDFPEVLAAFHDRASALGLADRAHSLPGDMHEAELEDGGWDLVLIANVLRLETPARARELVARLARAVTPGGGLLIVDALAHGSQEAELSRSVYALHLALRSRDGRVHPPAEVAEWTRAAGLPDGRALELGPQPGALAGWWAAKMPLSVGQLQPGDAP